MYLALPKIVRKSLSLASVLLGLILTSQSALAQSTATITISGTVLGFSMITATPAPILTSAELTGGVVGKVMSTVNEKSKKHDGYKVSLKSANAAAASSSQAFMKPSLSGNPDTINYSITYDGAPVTLVSGVALVTSATKKTKNAGVDKLVAITFAGGFWATDTYTDILTLTLTDN